MCAMYKQVCDINTNKYTSIHGDSIMMIMLMYSTPFTNYIFISFTVGYYTTTVETLLLPETHVHQMTS